MSRISGDFFDDIGNVKNLSLDLRDNEELRMLEKVFDTERPDEKPFLINLKLGETKWTCDCSIG